MTTQARIRVRVNEELVLDAGTREELLGPNGREVLVRPPGTTLFRQLLAYLQEKPDPAQRFSGSMAGREGVAAAALTLRWGSYLAVLLDREKPLWPVLDLESVSRISDEEMARINIEASAALAEWIELYRADASGRLYTQLVNRAVCYLPTPKKTSKLKVSQLAALADPEIATAFVRASDAARLERIQTESDRFPSRLFANALINTAWRNGPVERIHKGAFRGYPLDRRRITPAEERELMAIASERLALAMTVCLQLSIEQPQRCWSEQVLPFGLADKWLIAPTGWTLTETSREVRLLAST
jgi:hypothetical protein